MFITRDIWEGDSKMVIGIDFGTTQSSATYSCLVKGAHQPIRRVQIWPGQAARNGDGKVPSVMWYDLEGKPQAYGSQAVTPEMMTTAADNGWHLAEHFKLHLHPETMRSQNRIVVPNLPPYTTLEQVLADWFRYLYKCIKDFFVEREVEGAQLWSQLESTTDFVICHPNGWHTREQTFLRKVAIDAGLVPKEQGKTRVHFVTEAEASVHFFMIDGDLKTRLRLGTNLVVCDAGGSTVDTTLYTVKAVSPKLRLEELRASACIQAGGIYVTQSASEFLKEKLSRVFTGGDREACFREASDNFELETKRTFTGKEDDTAIKVGPRALNEPSINLRSGLLRVSRDAMNQFFAPWANDIIRSVKDQIQGCSVESIVLVGGFGDSPYLQDRFRDEFQNGTLLLPNDRSSEVVSDGGVIWHINCSVTARVSRITYGIAKQCQYDTSNPRHRGRTVVKTKDGGVLNGVWDPIVKKGQVLQAGKEIRRPLCNSYSSRNIDLSDMHLELYMFRGSEATQPYFVLDDNGTPLEPFTSICIIRADMSGMEKMMKTRWSLLGRTWKLEYQVAMLFGGTELKTHIVWTDGSKQEQQGLATIVPLRVKSDKTRRSSK